MATFPTYPVLLFDNQTQIETDPRVRTTQMERGIPRSEVLDPDVVDKLTLTAWFKTKADINNFEDWYRNTIKRVGAFDFTHPQKGIVISAWFPEGKIGPLIPLRGGFDMAHRVLTFQYIL